MEREKGIAYCGLVCALCSENSGCPGCRNEGCKDKDFCKNFRCCKEKGLNGCWECDEFPCTGSMLEKIRIRAFAGFIKEYGENCILDCLARNEEDGLIYHYPGQLIGDYDQPETEEKIRNLILKGRKR